MRKILQIDIRGTRLVGTYHMPTDGLSTALAGGPIPAAVGVLLFNVAQLPRAGLGDMPVQMADRLAARGYPVFRFDLPGLGDSPGELPEHVQTEWRRIQAGWYAPWAGALTTELKRRFELRGLILGGLCGGALNAIYAAEGRESDVLGLALLEPSFFLLGMSGPQIPNEALLPTRLYLRTAAKMRQIRQALRARLIGTPVGDRLLAVYDLFKRARDRVLNSRLPAGANLTLIDGCRRLAACGKPMLVVTAGSAFRKMIRRDIFGQTRRERVTFVEVEGTNHMLIPGGGKQTVVRQVEQWVLASFPLDMDKAASDAPAPAELAPIRTSKRDSAATHNSDAQPSGHMPGETPEGV